MAISRVKKVYHIKIGWNMASKNAKWQIVFWRKPLKIAHGLIFAPKIISALGDIFPNTILETLVWTLSSLGHVFVIIHLLVWIPSPSKRNFMPFNLVNPRKSKPIFVLVFCVQTFSLLLITFLARLNRKFIWLVLPSLRKNNKFWLHYFSPTLLA